MIAAREQKEISDTVSGISMNDISADLTRIQEEIRQKKDEGVNEQSEKDEDERSNSCSKNSYYESIYSCI